MIGKPEVPSLAYIKQKTVGRSQSTVDCQVKAMFIDCEVCMPTEQQERAVIDQWHETAGTLLSQYILTRRIWYTPLPALMFHLLIIPPKFPVISPF
jgi:hypothetical protein